MIRPLSSHERELIERIARQLGGSEGDQLLADLRNARALPATADDSRILFEISGYDRPAYRGQHPYRVEGRMLDRDGAEVTVLLHADANDRLLELELIRWAVGSLISPDWESLKLV
jgi:hypothetical protein